MGFARLSRPRLARAELAFLWEASQEDRRSAGQAGEKGGSEKKLLRRQLREQRPKPARSGGKPPPPKKTKAKCARTGKADDG
jgi:hypothetical protein